MNLPIVLAFFFMLQAGPSQATGGGIRGRVTYADGNPVSKSSVFARSISDSSQLSSAAIRSTNETGDYAFTSLIPGRYRIEITPAGTPVFYPGVTLVERASTVAIAIGANITGIDISIPTSASGQRVSGRVVRPQGSLQMQGPQRTARLTGDRFLAGAIAPDGTFEFQHVGAGSYTLQTDDPGMQPVPVVVSDRDVTGIEVAVPRVFEVRGKVTVENGSSVPKFQIDFNGELAETKLPIAPDGTFDVQLVEGEHKLTFSGLDARYYVKTATSEATDLLENPLKIEAKPNVILISITLGVSDGVKVSGHVTGMSQTIRATRIRLTSTVNEDRSVETAVGKDGTFEFVNVKPGNYAAHVSTAALNGPPVPVTIPNKMVRDLEIPIPVSKEIDGRVGVQGNGPYPKFSFLLIQGAEGLSGKDEASGLPRLSNILRRGTKSDIDAGVQIVQVDVKPLPDGSFKLAIPEGQYRIAAVESSVGIPPQFRLESMRYGAADLFTEALFVSETDSPSLTVEFGMKSQEPWVKVSGRVSGVNAGQGSFRVALESDDTSAMETIVNADGTFEFPRVLQDTKYAASIVPRDDAATSPRLSVMKKDIVDVQIVVPPKKEFVGRALTEDDVPTPGFELSLVNGSSRFSAVVHPDSNGFFKVKLPLDAQRVFIGGLPLGYGVKSLMFGAADLLKGPLKATESDTDELRIIFVLGPEIPVVPIKGRIHGLDSGHDGIRIELHSAASYSSFETIVNGDGTFEFSKLPQGIYIPKLIGLTGNVSFAPSFIAARDGEQPVEINASRDSADSSDTKAPAEATGVIMTELGAAASGGDGRAISMQRLLNTAEVTFLAPNQGNFGTMSQLIDAKLIPEKLRDSVNGTNYSIFAVGSNFIITAVPDSSSSGRYAYFTTPDGAVRYSTYEGLAPPGKAGAPVR